MYYIDTITSFDIQITTSYLKQGGILFVDLNETCYNRNLNVVIDTKLCVINAIEIVSEEGYDPKQDQDVLQNVDANIAYAESSFDMHDYDAAYISLKTAYDSLVSIQEKIDAFKSKDDPLTRYRNFIIGGISLTILIIIIHVSRRR